MDPQLRDAFVLVTCGSRDIGLAVARVALAGTVDHPASARASYVDGSTVPVDGGATPIVG